MQKAFDASRRMRDGIDLEEDPDLQSASEELSEISTDVMVRLSSLGVSLDEVSDQPDDVWEQRFNGVGKDVHDRVKAFEKVQAQKERTIARKYLGWTAKTDFADAMDDIMKALDSAKEMFGKDEKASALVLGILDRFDEYFDFSDIGILLDEDQFESLQDAYILRPGDIEELHRIVQFYGADVTVSQYRPNELPEIIQGKEGFLDHLNKGSFQAELLVGAEMLTPVFADMSAEDIVPGLEQIIADAVGEVEVVEAEANKGKDFTQKRLPLVHFLQRVVISLFENDRSFDSETDELKDVVKVAILALKLIMKRVQQSTLYSKYSSDADIRHHASTMRASSFMDVLGITDETEEADYDKIVATQRKVKGIDQLVRENPLDATLYEKWIAKAKQYSLEKSLEESEEGEDDDELEDWPGWDN